MKPAGGLYAPLGVSHSPRFTYVAIRRVAALGNCWRRALPATLTSTLWNGSSITAGWPGKCLAVTATPWACTPRTNALATRPVLLGSAWSVRLRSQGLTLVTTSTRGSA
jgi:hypothetical protein